MKDKIKAVLKIVVKVWFLIPFYLCSKLSQRLTYSIVLQEICESIEIVSPYFFSYNLRAKEAAKVISREKISPNADKFAIIMQGPLILKNDFTLETIKLYERIFPGVLVIVSTWDNEDFVYVERIKKGTSAKVIMNKYPAYSGFMNGNYQMVTTVSGLKVAQESEKKFVFKTRCDYRFYKKGLLEFMYNLLLDYPGVQDELNQKYRIIMTSGRHDDMFRPFYIGDQFQFGYINDLMNFWNNELIQCNYTIADFYQFCKRGNFTWKQEREYTSILTKRYVKKMTGKDIDISVETYWKYAKDYLIFLSAKDTDAYWCKYNERFEETRGNGEFYREDSLETCLSYNWNFALWNVLYHDKLEYNDDMEKISESNYL